MKKILSKLVKIAENQQQILHKLAQDAVENALNDFVKYQLVSWSLPKEVAAKEYHTADRTIGDKHFNVKMTLSLSDKSKKAVVEDPYNGFAAWLTKKFNEAASDPNSKWKALNGFTASWDITTN